MTERAEQEVRVYRRLMLRSAFQSLFWSVIVDRKKSKRLTMSALADQLGVNKSYISRSFSSPPNWQIDKIADMSVALGVELEPMARDLNTGAIYTPTGKLEFAEAKTSGDRSHWLASPPNVPAASTARTTYSVVAA
jgi:hypothetical protein